MNLIRKKNSLKNLIDIRNKIYGSFNYKDDIKEILLWRKKSSLNIAVGPAIDNTAPTLSSRHSG